MRSTILVFVLFFSSLVVAQMPPGMQEAIDCMQSVDQDALRELGTQSESVANEIKALCADGDVSGARKVAMAYAQEMTDNEAVAELKRCSEMMREVMPNMPMPEIPSTEMFEEESGNICDNIDQ